MPKQNKPENKQEIRISLKYDRRAIGFILEVEVPTEARSISYGKMHLLPRIAGSAERLKFRVRARDFLLRLFDDAVHAGRGLSKSDLERWKRKLANARRMRTIEKKRKANG